MKFITGQSRHQVSLLPKSLEESIDPDNEVRLIDLFVDSLKLEEFGFRLEFIENGRPAYHPADLLKLFLYGYLNRIRSSRALEKECTRNIELMWLLKGLVPDHNTISNFRKNNSKAIKNVFRATVGIAKHFDLIGGQLVAGDSTKLRAQNSKKNNFNEKKIEQHLEYIDNKLAEYEKALAAADKQEDKSKALSDKEALKKEIYTQKKRKAEYQRMQRQLKETGEAQISTSDPDSRQMITRNNITEVAYNVQTTVDAAHCIPIDFQVTNTNDSKAMGNMLAHACAELGHTRFTALYDKGYHTGSEFKAAADLGVTVMVAIPAVASHAPDTTFDIANFLYDQQTDTYTCPAGQILSTNGHWYTKNRGKSSNQVKHYKTDACGTCPLAQKCTRNAHGRLIERSEYAELIEQNRIRIEQYKDLYRKRQSVVEHPYGTIKRQWDFSYIMTKKTLERAAADVGLIFTAYNLRRIFTLLPKDLLQAYLEKLWHAFFPKITFLKAIRTLLPPPKNSLVKSTANFIFAYPPLLGSQIVNLEEGF